MTSKNPLFDVTDDVSGIDLEMFDTETLAAYVIDDPYPVLVETGFNNAAGRLYEGLRAADVDVKDLAAAVVSHVHIDHSGGAAALVADAPDLDIYVHESTADHLIEPARLIESSREAMGEHFEAMGSQENVPEENIIRVPDEGTIIETGARELELVHTPGHAGDHIAVWDPTSGTLFVNEAVGSRYPRADDWLPPATLPQFNVEVVRKTIDRLHRFDADRLALSHFGVLENPSVELNRAEARLDEFDERIPVLYEKRGDVAETAQVVREKLLGLDAYADALADFEASFQTRGFLRANGLL